MATDGTPATRRLVLASQSRSRRQMLEAAGLRFEAIASSVDEPRLRRELEARGADTRPEAIARALAAAKAEDVSRLHPDALVIGGDQVLALGTEVFEKPVGRVGARRHLMAFRGRAHVLISAVVLAEGATLAPDLFGDFLALQSDLSPKAWPRYVWIADELPATATNKVLKRELVAHGADPVGGQLWTREPRGLRYVLAVAAE